MTSKEYWIKRAEENDARNLSHMGAGIARIQEAFASAEEEIQARIDAFYQKYSEGGIVDLANARKRLTPSEMTALRKRIAKLQQTATTPEEKAQLEALKRRAYISRQEALLAEIQARVTRLTAKTDDTIGRTLREIVEDQLSHDQFNIEQSIGWAVNFEGMSSAQIDTLIKTGYDGKDFSSKVWYNRDQLVKNLNVLLPREFLLGKSMQDIAKTLSKAMNTPKYAAETLVRTEGSYVASQADMTTYQQANIEEYEFLAVLDNRTSEMCAELDGKTFKRSEAVVGLNLPPIHPNCRSTTLPVVDMSDFDEERLAKDEDGQYIVVPKTMTYKQWKDSLPKRSNAVASSGNSVAWDALRWSASKQELIAKAKKLIDGSVPDDVLAAKDDPEMLKRIRANALQTMNENAARYLQAEEAFNKLLSGSGPEAAKLRSDMHKYASEVVQYANKVNAIDTKAYTIVKPVEIPKTAEINVLKQNPFTKTEPSEMRKQLAEDYKVNTQNLSDTHVEHVYEGIRQMYEREPELTAAGLKYLPEIDYFTEQQQKANPNTYAWVYQRSRRMQINPEYYTEEMRPLIRSYARDIRLDWHPNGDIYSAFQHEFGHVLGFGYSINAKFKRENIIERAWTAAKKEDALLGSVYNKAEWRERISKYATKDLMETWAEAWADWIHNGDLASDTSIKIVAEFKKEVAKLK